MDKHLRAIKTIASKSTGPISYRMLTYPDGIVTCGHCRIVRNLNLSKIGSSGQF
jgi:hypothetical protein